MEEKRQHGINSPRMYMVLDLHTDSSYSVKECKQYRSRSCSKQELQKVPSESLLYHPGPQQTYIGMSVAQGINSD